MHLLLAAAVLATSVFAVPGSVCSKAPFKALLLPLSKNPYAQVFCTSRLTLPAITSTIATTTLTATATASSTITMYVVVNAFKPNAEMLLTKSIIQFYDLDAHSCGFKFRARSRDQHRGRDFHTDDHGDLYHDADDHVNIDAGYDYYHCDRW